MRGMDETSGSLFSYVDLEERIPARHPLRKIRQVVNDALASLDAEFESLYTDFGRPSIPPERLIRASLLQILFSVRSERQLMEQMDYNLMFRWFVGLGIDDPVWVPTVFTKNRDRLLSTEMSRKVMAAILAHREVSPLLSDEHFSVDGTLVKAWASMKSFQPKAETAPPDEDGPGDPPASDTTPDPAASETPAEIDPMPRNTKTHRNAEVDFKGYDAGGFVRDPRQACVTPHVAQKSRYAAIDGRTARHEGYGHSQRHRKKIEEAFGWAKTIGGRAQTMYRGVESVRSRFILTMAKNTLERLPRLLTA